MSCEVNQWGKADVMMLYGWDHTMAGYIEYD